MFGEVSDSYARLYSSGSLWIDEFSLVQLRQRDDASFAELLCCVRKSQCTHEDVDILRARAIKECTPTFNIPKECK